MTELDKLEQILKEKGIVYTRTDEDRTEYNEDNIGEFHQFHQIQVTGSHYSWDVICHRGSFGYEKGLLEYNDTIEPDVIGYLTADAVMELVETSEYRRGYQDAVKQIQNTLDTISDIRKR